MYVDCSLKRTYYSVLKALAGQVGVKAKPVGVALEEVLSIERRTVVLDDYTLARRSQRLTSLVKRLAEKNKVVLVVHPSIRGEVAGIVNAEIEMPPYTPRELYEILEDRVLMGKLPVAEEAIHAVSERIGYPKGTGSARIAILTLRKALELALERRECEVLSRHVEAAFKLLSI